MMKISLVSAFLFSFFSVNQLVLMSRSKFPWMSPSSSVQTRRRLGGRHPLCGIGVTSLIEMTPRPAACSARTADSRPPPGPFTCTTTARIPTSEHLRAHASAAICAAYGVPLREPLKPTDPALDHAITVPLVIGDRDDRVVEGCVHMRDAFGHVAAHLLAARRRGRCSSGAGGSRGSRGTGFLLGCGFGLFNFFSHLLSESVCLLIVGRQFPFSANPFVCRLSAKISFFSESVCVQTGSEISLAAHVLGYVSPSAVPVSCRRLLCADLCACGH
jgi:hypothetical protein